MSFRNVVVLTVALTAGFSSSAVAQAPQTGLVAVFPQDGTILPAKLGGTLLFEVSVSKSVGKFKLSAASLAETAGPVASASVLFGEYKTEFLELTVGKDVTKDGPLSISVLVEQPDGSNLTVAHAQFTVHTVISAEKLKQANGAVGCTMGGSGLAQILMAATGGEKTDYHWWSSEGTVALGGYQFNHGAVVDYWSTTTPSGNPIQVVVENGGDYGLCKLPAR